MVSTHRPTRLDPWGIPLLHGFPTYRCIAPLDGQAALTCNAFVR